MSIAHPPSTEPIMAALFALAQSVNSPATPFKIMSRRFRHFNDVKPEEMPAFFQMQFPGIKTERGERGIPVKKRRAYWAVYLPKSQGLNDVVSPLMNQYYDALSNVLLPGGPQGRQTLGGLCINAYEDGMGLADEGLLTTPSMILIPITILNGI